MGNSSIFQPGTILTFFMSILFWTYVVFHSFFIGFPIAVLIRILHLFYDRERRVLLHWWTTQWAYHYHHWNPFCQTTILGREVIKKVKDRAVIFVCNHQSTTDIMLLYGIETHFKWVSKSSNFQIPFIGWNMWMNDYVPVTRGDKDSVHKMFDHCKRQLNAGNSLVFFPEGSRSTDGQIKAFKPGAFSLAMEAQVPIVPMVIDGTADCLTAGKGMTVAIYNGGGWKITLKVLDPIYPEEFGDSIESLMEKVRNVMVNDFEKIKVQGISQGKQPTDKKLR
uniref:Phospholipid/glycerol acyltransferase domain-containing protein n=1 Tax=Hanusia phi TaxID=3032 RepID=A0A7S0EBP5_9CRYP|mmetsp:Transcript_20479/g.46430  ORF Transcript_20479/g.46430 Transcript_20479/m.46430 type:complete len:279 (+) Transcript_20479:79-915(+)